MRYWRNLISHVCGDPAAANEPWKAAELLRFLEHELKDQPKKKKFQLRAFFPPDILVSRFRKKRKEMVARVQEAAARWFSSVLPPFFLNWLQRNPNMAEWSFMFLKRPPLNFVSQLLSKWMALKNTSDLEKVPLKKNKNNKQHICRVKLDTGSLVSPHPIIGLSLKTLSGGLNKWVTIKGLD